MISIHIRTYHGSSLQSFDGRKWLYYGYEIPMDGGRGIMGDISVIYIYIYIYIY